MNAINKIGKATCLNTMGIYEDPTSTTLQKRKSGMDTTRATESGSKEW
eukprot:CAMPEP_0114486540 /NCGR_PEP_ID=MMETSP0109-20121206/270_1 /TAXON_ID=29199 /ORGANISM="Chlorarachnion reptans, Strain CCCM449" /LENGTH=47 /DNA_ID= /DNA_START= /DNA_END= /DNA_ORIENTATION=